MEEKMHVATAMDIQKKLHRILTKLTEELKGYPKRVEALEELRKLVENVKVKYAKKPIPKEAWDNVWSDVISDFIMTFQSNAVRYEVEADEDPHEWFLRGMANGMWTIYNMIEELMVEGQ